MQISKRKSVAIGIQPSILNTDVYCFCCNVTWLVCLPLCAFSFPLSLDSQCKSLSIAPILSILSLSMPLLVSNNTLRHQQWRGLDNLPSPCRHAHFLNLAISAATIMRVEEKSSSMLGVFHFMSDCAFRFLSHERCRLPIQVSCNLACSFLSVFCRLLMIFTWSLIRFYCIFQLFLFYFLVIVRILTHNSWEFYFISIF